MIIFLEGVSFTVANKQPTTLYGQFQPKSLSSLGCWWVGCVGGKQKKAKDSVQLSLLTGTRTEFGNNYISIIDNVRTKSLKTILKKTST